MSLENLSTAAPLKAVLDAAGTMMVACAPDGAVRVFNTAAERLLGWKAGEIVGRHTPVHWHDLEEITTRATELSQQLGRHVAAGFEVLVADAEAFSDEPREWTYVRQDGSRFPVHLEVSAIRCDAGSVTGYLCTAQDLTRRVPDAQKDAQNQVTTALGASDQRYRTLLERIPTPLFVYDRETLEYLVVSDSAVREYGYSREEWMQMTLADIRPPEDVPSLLETLAAGGELFEKRGLWRHKKRDGTMIDVDITTHGVELNGRSAAIVLAKDVTEQLRAERELRQTNALLRAVADGTPDALYVKDRQGRYLLFNQAAASFVGRPVEEVLGQDDLFVFGPRDGQAVMENDRMVMESNQPQSIDEELTAAGVTRNYHATKAPLRDAQGNVMGVIGISRDITDRKLIENSLVETNATLEQRVYERTRELRDSEQFNRATLDALSAHVAVVDSRGTIVATNAAWKKFALANATPWQRVSENCNYLSVCDAAAEQGDADAVQVAEALRSILAGRCDTSRHEYACHSPSEQRWFDCVITPCSIQHQPYAVVAHENVTNSKSAQEELRIAKDHADQASLAKSEFLATMSHELRTPLNGILGMNEMLLRTELDERQRRFAEASQTSGQLLAQLINDVLDLSKIEAGKLELDPREADVEALIYDVVDMLAPAAQLKGLSLTCCLSQTACVLAHFDDNRLRQVLVNLVGNAVKFTASGGVTISGDRWIQDQQSDRLRIRVADTGIGIPQERQDRLFKAFSQVDNSTTRQFGGTGLGLSICRQLIEMMGGQIGVESRAGVGSTFWFEIPVEVIPGSTRPPRRQRSLLGRRVLAVGGLDPERRQIAECLVNWGCPLEQPTTAAQALQAARDARAAGDSLPVAIIDLSLAVDSDLAALESLTREFAGLVIGLGSPTQQLSPAELRALGVQHVLRDPVRPSELFDTLASLLSTIDAVPPPRFQSASGLALPPLSAAFVGHILVAEDNTINQLYITELLKLMGCTCEVAENGEQVLAAIERQRYDLVLMDCQMPEMDGFVAAKKIRKREATSPTTSDRLPIVALTANALKGDRERCLAAGMDDYLAKPIDSEQLRVALQKFLPSS